MKNYFALFIILLLAAAVSCTKSSNGPEPVNEKKWMVSSFAGDGSPHFADGPALLSKFSAPLDVVVSGNGAVYVADALNHRIRKIENGQVSTVAGFGREDTVNGTGITAGFALPVQMTCDASGNLYTIDIHDFRIRKISSDGVVTTVAGSGIRGYANGRADTARFGECSGIAVNDHGDIYVTDYDSRRIRKISATGVVSTVAGSGAQGFVDARGEAAEFFSPSGIVSDKQGNLYVADWNRIRKINAEGR